MVDPVTITILGTVIMTTIVGGSVLSRAIKDGVDKIKHWHKKRKESKRLRTVISQNTNPYMFFCMAAEATNITKNIHTRTHVSSTAGNSTRIYDVPVTVLKGSKKSKKIFVTGSNKVWYEYFNGQFCVMAHHSNKEEYDNYIDYLELQVKNSGAAVTFKKDCKDKTN